MDWTKESSKDSLLLHRLDLGPLDPALAGGDERLAGLLDANNSQVAGLVERFATLADHRKRLADFQNWMDADASNIEANLSALRRESWNLLVAVRKFLEERGAIIEGLFAAAGARVAELSSQHDAIRDRTAKALKREHRRMVAATPTTAGMHFADLVDGTDEVAAACQEIAPAQEILDRVSTVRQKQESNQWAVKARQREVFPLIAA